VGELTQNIAKLMEFAKMRHLERGYPCLLQIDEADAILQQREGQQPQHHEEQVGVNQFLTEFDDLRASPGVAIILTTNLHEALDEAVKKRTNAQWIRFPSPGSGVRFYLLKRFLGNQFSSSDLRQLAGQTNGFAPRDIVELCRTAFYKAISQDAPVTLDLLLRQAALLAMSPPQGRNGKTVSMKTDSTMRLLEFTNHVNGLTKKAAV
jgi:SpoVK/Ycf46/Vps4 family AAA+-type ATPase